MNSAEFMHIKFYTDNSKTFCKTQLMNIYIENKKRKVEEQDITPCKLVEKNASINVKRKIRCGATVVTLKTNLCTTDDGIYFTVH